LDKGAFLAATMAAMMRALDLGDELVGAEESEGASDAGAGLATRCIVGDVRMEHPDQVAVAEAIASRRGS